MKLNIFNINEFIKLNHVQQITNPIALSGGHIPSPDGIYSYEIFGYTTEERKNIFGYIDLKQPYFHPQAIKALGRMGSLGKIINGEKYAVVVDRKIHPIKPEERDMYPDAQTGIDFFYDNWEKINWNAASVTTRDQTDADEDLSIDKRARLKLFRVLPKSCIFVDKWLVLPPYYRDFNAQDSTMGDDINKVYKELILKTNALHSSFGDDFGFSTIGNSTRNRIQDLLMILYNMALNPITGKTINIQTMETPGNSKTSMLKRNLVGRFLDFSASSVITSPVSSATETVEDFHKFGEVTLPIQTCMAMFKPFILNYCQTFLEDAIQATRNMKYYKFKIADLNQNQYSVDEIDKTVTRFIKSATEKDIPVTIKYKSVEGVNEEFGFMLNEYDEHMNHIISRPMTYLDLFYLACEKVCEDKYSINTRYPIANNQNIYPAKIRVNSTNYTRHIFVEFGFKPIQECKHYPYISYDKIKEKTDGAIVDPNPKSKIYYEIFRSTIIGNGVIKSLGADYDGDMMFFRGLFTKEANEEAEKWIWKKTNWFNAEGALSRGLTKISKDCTLALYELTKN